MLIDVQSICASAVRTAVFDWTAWADVQVPSATGTRPGAWEWLGVHGWEE